MLQIKYCWLIGLLHLQINNQYYKQNTQKKVSDNKQPALHFETI